jgi:hypothetical protein
MIEGMFLVWVVLGLVLWGMFIMISVNIGNIRKNIQSIQRMIDGFQKDTGMGVMFNCKSCEKMYYGAKDKCPYCGDPKEYSDEGFVNKR